jgi:hypothetical protein
VGDPGLDLKCRFLSAAWAVVDVLTIGKLGTGARQLEYYERQVAAGGLRITMPGGVRLRVSGSGPGSGRSGSMRAGRWAARGSWR